ncbi:MAG: geranylgeranyl reductase family protein [Syntrophaceae bacterium]
MTEVYDVIVAGMGPAGSTACYHLARAGLKVLGLEKRVMPRPKLCAGALSPRAVALLDCDISAAVECEVRGAAIYARSGQALHMSTQDTRGLIVDRPRFDHLLLKRAAAAGALVHEGESVAKITPGEIIEVQTGRATYQTRHLIGADGANSVVARKLGYPRRHGGYALECTIPDRYEAVRRHPDVPVFFYGYLPSGYGWVFPKHGGASVGIGVYAEHARAIRTHFHDFLDAIGLPNEYADHCKGFALPGCTIRTLRRHGRDNILLTGDAACLVDPMTGEGISYAMQSGGLAARAILDYPGVLEPSSRIYGRLLKPLRRDLLFAYLITMPLNRFPEMSILSLRENPEVARILKNITMGQARYRDLLMVGFKAVPATLRAYFKGRR